MPTRPWASAASGRTATAALASAAPRAAMRSRRITKGRPRGIAICVPAFSSSTSKRPSMVAVKSNSTLPPAVDVLLQVVAVHMDLVGRIGLDLEPDLVALGVRDRLDAAGGLAVDDADRLDGGLGGRRGRRRAGARSSVDVEVDVAGSLAVGSEPLGRGGRLRRRGRGRAAVVVVPAQDDEDDQQDREAAEDDAGPLDARQPPARIVAACARRGLGRGHEASKGTGRANGPPRMRT